MGVIKANSIADIVFSSEIYISDIPVFYRSKVIAADSITDVIFSSEVYIFEAPVTHDNRVVEADSIDDIVFSTEAYVFDPPVVYNDNVIRHQMTTKDDPNGKSYEAGPPIIYTDSPNVIITGEVIAEFTGIPRTGGLPLVVQFTSNVPDYGTVVEWDFGDGTTSTDINPVHVYDRYGTYEVILKTLFYGVEYLSKRKSYITIAPLSNLPDVVAEITKNTLFKNTFEVKRRF